MNRGESGWIGCCSLHPIIVSTVSMPSAKVSGLAGYYKHSRLAGLSFYFGLFSDTLEPFFFYLQEEDEVI